MNLSALTAVWTWRSGPPRPTHSGARAPRRAEAGCPRDRAGGSPRVGALAGTAGPRCADSLSGEHGAEVGLPASCPRCFGDPAPVGEIVGALSTRPGALVSFAWNDRRC